jgi:sugar phosphate isomerase/epimerase
METWVEALGPFIGQLHLHDNAGRQDDHLPLGGGAIDFPMLFKKLGAMRSVPPLITLEPHREDDLWPSVACLEKIWPW